MAGQIARRGETVDVDRIAADLEARHAEVWALARRVRAAGPIYVVSHSVEAAARWRESHSEESGLDGEADYRLVGKLADIDGPGAVVLAPGWPDVLDWLDPHRLRNAGHDVLIGSFPGAIGRRWTSVIA